MIVDDGLVLVTGLLPPTSTYVQGAEAQNEGAVNVLVKAGKEVTSLNADMACQRAKRQSLASSRHKDRELMRLFTVKTSCFLQRVAGSLRL